MCVNVSDASSLLHATVHRPEEHLGNHWRGPSGGRHLVHAVPVGQLCRLQMCALTVLSAGSTHRAVAPAAYLSPSHCSGSVLCACHLPAALCDSCTTVHHTVLHVSQCITLSSHWAGAFSIALATPANRYRVFVTDLATFSKPKVSSGRPGAACVTQPWGPQTKRQHLSFDHALVGLERGSSPFAPGSCFSTCWHRTI